MSGARGRLERIFTCEEDEGMTVEQLLEKYGWYIEYRIQAEMIGGILALAILAGALLWFLGELVKIWWRKK